MTTAIGIFRVLRTCTNRYLSTAVQHTYPDELLHPDKDILLETTPQDMRIIPTVNINNTNTELDITFKLADYDTRWKTIVGGRLYLLYNLMHWSSRFLWLFGADLWPPKYYFNTFYRALRVQLTPESIAKYKSGVNPFSLDATYHSRVITVGVGSTSYRMSARTRLDDGFPVANIDHLLITVDTERRTSAPVDAQWKEDVLKHLEQTEMKNEAFDLPEIPESRVMFTKELTMIPEYIDHNKHVNAKIYMLGAIGTIRVALNEGVELWQGAPGTRFEDITTEDIVSVFEREANLGDVLRFEILSPLEQVYLNKHEIFVVCYNGSQRVHYCRYLIS